MGVRSVIDIDLNGNEAFAKFAALYDRYQNNLKAAPQEWAKVTASIGRTRKEFDQIVNQQIAIQARTKLIAEAQREAARLTQTSAERWKDIAQSAKDVYSSISRTTMSLLKWGGIFSGVLGVGGLFGLSQLAENVAGARRSSSGLGIGIGQQKSFGLNFGRFVDAQSLLSNVSTALYDATSRGYTGLLGAGISPGFLKGRNAADVSSELLARIPRLFSGTPEHLIGARLRSLNLDELLSQQDVVRYLHTSPQERDEQRRRYGQDTSRLNVDPDTARKWQDFTTQLSRAGDSIENIFVKGLVKLAGPIENFSDRLEKLVDRVLGSDSIRTGIDKFATGIERAAQYIGTDEFQDNVRSFVDGVGKVGRAIAWLASFIPGGSSAPSTTGHSPWSATPPPGYRTAPGMGGALIKNDALDQYSLSGMIRRLENSGDSAVSPAGAIGRYQIMPGTAKQYGFDPSQLKDPIYNKMVAEAVIRDLIKRYNGNTDEILAAYNGGPGRANQMRAAGGNTGVLPLETQKYIERAHGMQGYSQKVTVEVLNNTGGNSIVTTSQAAQ